MNLRTKTIASACATLTFGLAGALSAQPAQARWIFHNDVGENITAPSGGTRFQVCHTRLKGLNGFGKFVGVEGGWDPAAVQLPPQATAGADYELWKAPPGIEGFRDGLLRDENGLYYEGADGGRQPAILVASFTTPARTVLPTPVPVGGNPNVSDTFVFTSAPISIRLHGVKPGDALGLRLVNNNFEEFTAINCRLKVVKAKLDVIPGSKANAVQLSNGGELIPVRIYGSKRLRVMKIKQVHLGKAKPAAVPAELKSSLKPKDVNRDGRPDRLYYFHSGEAWISCSDTTVEVAGQTSDKIRVAAKAPITARCDG